MIITHISTLFSQKQHPTPPFFQNHYPTPTIPHTIDKVKIKAHRTITPALKFTKEILGEVSRSDGGVKNRSATEGIKKSPQGNNSPPATKWIGEPRRAHE